MLWGSDGKFQGINTTGQGAAYDEQTTIDGLNNAIGTLTNEIGQGQAPTVDSSQLVALLQQQNLTLSETLALNEAQTGVLRGMIPEIPQYAAGGPVLRDGLIYAHQGEHVVPTGGTLVSSGGGGGPTHISLEQHYHGTAAALMSLIDQRIRHPENVRAVSKEFGRRTKLLSR